MKETRYLTYEEAIAIHASSIRRYGGIEGLRDRGLLESALMQPRQTFDGVELYPTLAEKAARYAFGIINNHPFADGNKRTGAAIFGVLLRGNGCRFKPRLVEMQSIVLGVADGSVGFDELVEWTEQQLQNES